MATANEEDDHNQPMGRSISLASLTNLFPVDYDENELLEKEEGATNCNLRATEDTQIHDLSVKLEEALNVSNENCNQHNANAEVVALNVEKGARLGTAMESTLQRDADKHGNTKDNNISSQPQVSFANNPFIISMAQTILLFSYAYLMQMSKPFQIDRAETEMGEDIDIDQYFTGKLLLVLQQ